MATTRTYRGLITEEADGFAIGGIPVTVDSDIRDFGRHLTARYLIGEDEFPAETVNDASVRRFWVGGGELLDELRRHAGSFAHLEITYSEETP